MFCDKHRRNDLLVDVEFPESHFVIVEEFHYNLKFFLFSGVLSVVFVFSQVVIKNFQVIRMTITWSSNRPYFLLICVTCCFLLHYMFFLKANKFLLLNFINNFLNNYQHVYFLVFGRYSFR